MIERLANGWLFYVSLFFIVLSLMETDSNSALKLILGAVCYALLYIGQGINDR